MTSPNRQTYIFDARDNLTPTLGNQARASSGTERALDQLGRQAKRTAADMTVAERATARFTDELADARREAERLDKTLRTHKRIDIGGLAGGGGRAAMSLGGAGGKAGGMFSGLFGQALGSPLLAAGIGGGVASSPAIAAALAGAVQAAFGGGAIALGIASGVRDPAVKKAFAPLGQDLKELFIDVGGPFKGPLKDSAVVFRKELRAVRNEWVEGIGSMASVVTPLARGIAGLFREATPGFLKVLEASKPTLEMLAAKLPGLGEDISTMLESFAQSGPGAVQAINDLVDGLGDILVVSGETIEALSKTYGWIQKLNESALFSYTRDQTTSYLKGASKGWETVAEATQNATKRLQDWNSAMDEAFGEQMSLDEATDAFKQNFLELNEMIRQNNRDLRDSTMAGLENRSFIRDWIEDAKRMRDAAIAMGGGTKESIEKANRAYEGHLEQIRKTLIQRGFEKKAVDAIIAAYRALAALPNITKLVTIKTVTQGQVGTSGARPGQLPFYAEGGPVTRGMPVVVGDAGRPEVFVPDSDGFIHPDARSFAAAGGGREFTFRFIHQYPDGRVIVEQVQQHASQTGQNSVSGVFALPA